jgi:glycosyltransferase involved in cell wall biosynthesis
MANSQDWPMHADNPRRSGGRRLNGVIAEGNADQPLVTVITAVYNGQPHVAGCLESVLRQDYPNIEHLVLDGGSSDGTLDVLLEYNDKLALWKSEPDKGVYDAWNKGLAEARGEWICFLGIDDEFLPGAVNAYMELAAMTPTAEYLSSQVRWVHSSGYVRIVGHPWTWKRFSKSMCTAHVGSMHRRSMYDRLGMYDTSYRIVADYELLLRARDQLKSAYVPLITVIMRGGGVSDTSSALSEATRAIVRTGGRHSIVATLELYFAKIKFIFRPLRWALRKTAARG